MPYEGWALLDVRERGAYALGHLPGAVSLPRRLIESQLPRLVTDLSTPITLYSEDSEIAPLGAVTVKEMGYREVTVVGGRLTDLEAGYGRTLQGLNVVAKAFGERIAHERWTPTIDPDQLVGLLDSGGQVALFDVRPPDEYLAGHIPGARNLSTGELVLQASELRTPVVVVHCGGRTRAIIAAESLREAGLDGKVLALENGTMGWLLSGREIETGDRFDGDDALGTTFGLGASAPLAPQDLPNLGSLSLTSLALAELWSERESHNLVIFDCRSEREYLLGHVPGARYLPVVQVIQAIDEYVAVRETTIVLTCDTTIRSLLGATWLRRMGYPRAFVLAGGVIDYAHVFGCLERGWPDDRPWGVDKAQRMIPEADPQLVPRSVVLSLDSSDVYARTHLAGAVWICRSRLEQRCASVFRDRTAPIVLASCEESQSWLGARTLHELGYVRVSVLRGGPKEWSENGIELENGPTRLADDSDDVVLKPYQVGPTAMDRYLRWEEALDANGWSPVDLWRD